MNEKNYRYYRVTGQEVIDLNKRWGEISKARQAILDQLLKDSGAVAWGENRGWGENGTLLNALAFPHDHDFGVPVTVKHTHQFDGKKVVVVRGKGRTSEARALNAKLDGFVKAANAKLKDTPVYQDFLINHYNVKLSTLGAPSEIRFGAVSMISTYCGQAANDENTLVFAIPIAQEKNDRQPEVPASFEEITYGQFYDLTNE